MRDIYRNNAINAPRLKTDKCFADYENEYKYSGFIDDTFKFVEQFQLLSPEHWTRFVRQFREDADFEAGWRGEYWGKMMRGATFVYSYSKNEELYRLLTQTVRDMMDSADENGRISSYAVNHEFDGWDMWARKYVLLGMQYYIEICEDEDFKREIIASMCRQVDYIMSKVGEEEGKKKITSCTRHWRGLNASSILEAIVRLYSLTKEQKYFDFAEYIIDCGGADCENIFTLAYENNFSPYQYPVTKAYEMTSCFEGLLEFYRITGIEKYKTAIVNFANKILETDFTVIGCCGCTHELFDHSTVRQATPIDENNPDTKIMQETCVTVTLMKFFYQLHLITGDAKFVDAFEISLYNAYLGAVNTEKVIPEWIKEQHPDWTHEPMPFDSYSPLTANTRGTGIGGLKKMSDGYYYGCCACIGAAGIGLVPKMQLLTRKDGVEINLYINGSVKTKTPTGEDVKFIIDTAYPKSNKVKITVETAGNEEFTVALRNPEWSISTDITLNGAPIEDTDEYVEISRTWHNGDVIDVMFEMKTKAILPICYGSQILMNKVVWGMNYMVPTFDKEHPDLHRHIALRRGPVMFAQEARLGYSVDEPVDIAVNPDGTVDISLPDADTAPYPHIIEAQIPLTDGRKITVTDYASAGKLWTEESKMAVWMLTN